MRNCHSATPPIVPIKIFEKVNGVDGTIGGVCGIQAAVMFEMFVPAAKPFSHNQLTYRLHGRLDSALSPKPSLWLAAE